MVDALIDEVLVELGLCPAVIRDDGVRLTVPVEDIRLEPRPGRFRPFIRQYADFRPAGKIVHTSDDICGFCQGHEVDSPVLKRLRGSLLRERLRWGQKPRSCLCAGWTGLDHLLNIGVHPIPVVLLSEIRRNNFRLCMSQLLRMNVSDKRRALGRLWDYPPFPRTAMLEASLNDPMALDPLLDALLFVLQSVDGEIAIPEIVQHSAVIPNLQLLRRHRRKKCLEDRVCDFKAVGRTYGESWPLNNLSNVE